MANSDAYPELSDLVSYDTDNEGNTTLMVDGVDSDGEDVTATLTLSPRALNELATRTVRQAMGAAIIAGVR